MRHVLSLFDYTNKDPEIVGAPDPLIVGPASDLFEDDERPERMFPTL
jgi:polyphosphate kinase